MSYCRSSNDKSITLDDHINNFQKFLDRKIIDERNKKLSLLNKKKGEVSLLLMNTKDLIKCSNEKTQVIPKRNIPIIPWEFTKSSKLRLKRKSKVKRLIPLVKKTDKNVKNVNKPKRNKAKYNKNK